MDILKRIFGSPEEQFAPEVGETFLLVGLGNPGREHKHNRHNIGFMAIDRLAAAHDVPLGKVQQQAVTGSFQLEGQRVILAKPKTWMNRSGDAVGPLANFYKLEPEQVLVVYDELDLPFGTLRLREQGGSGGHNGMKSIINHLGQEFPRLRLGIGRPPGKMPVPAYVLQDFHPRDAAVVDLMLDRAVQGMETFVREGITLAMSRFNGTVVDNS